MTRTAHIITPDPEAIPAYLPDNYGIVRVETLENGKKQVTIQGEDRAGWTLDGYVLPRLASGLHFGKEVTA